MDDDATQFLKKAQESLASAESDLLNGRYNSCANRCYYACYQAAIAALLREGIRPAGNWGHKFVQVQFNGQLIHRRKRYTSELRRTLIHLLDLRGIADYTVESITRAEARSALAQTRTFVRAITERLGT